MASISNNIKRRVLQAQAAADMSSSQMRKMMGEAHAEGVEFFDGLEDAIEAADTAADALDFASRELDRGRVDTATQGLRSALRALQDASRETRRERATIQAGRLQAAANSVEEALDGLRNLDAED